MGPVAHIGNKRSACRVLVGRPKCKRPLARYRHRWIILKRIFKKWDGESWFGLIWLRKGTGDCECSNEPLCSINCWIIS
jgi:hypothetical protein